MTLAQLKECIDTLCESGHSDSLILNHHMMMISGARFHYDTKVLILETY